jgi:5-(hydroxymethyl)furfural/furfural oxidase
MWALRGVPGDYDGWAAAGAEGWSWSDVLPFFCRLEADCDFAGALHGADGPIPIRRQKPRDWSPLATAVHAAAGTLGFTDIDDMNGDFRDGHCALPISRYADSRASGAICYLAAEVRRRPNLRVVTDATVTKLVLEGRHVCGVEVRHSDGRAGAYAAGETILAAGALHTPVLMMRAGIGPAAHLADMGVTAVADRRGVGRNLQNHPLLPAVAVVPGALTESALDRPPAGTYLRWSSGVPGGTVGDMGLYIRSYLVWHALGRRLAMLAPVLMKPRSTGWVRLAGPSADAAPQIAFNFFDDPRDLERIMAGFRLATRIFAAPEVRQVCGEAFVLFEAGRLAKYNNLSRRNAALGWLGAKMFDASPRAGMRLLNTLAQTRPLRDFVDDDDALADFVRGNIIGTNHVSGTCRIGAADDPMAVVDPAGAVYGVGGLRVADASAMPSVPSGNTHIPTVMVAEKIADAIKTGARQRARPGWRSAMRRDEASLQRNET